MDGRDDGVGHSGHGFVPPFIWGMWSLGAEPFVERRTCQNSQLLETSKSRRAFGPRLTLLMAHRARCLADEPGTLQFEVLLPREDQTKVLLYEVYTDDAAFEAHWSGPSTNRLREEAAEMIVGVKGTRCALAD